MKLARVILLSLVASSLSACATFSPADFRAFIAEREGPAEVQFHGVGLQSGQLILSDAGAPDSLLLSLAGERYSPFGHAGIISIEGGKAYVYEGYATLRPFTTGPPTDAMRGHIRRVTIEDYIRRQRVTAIYDPPVGVDKAAVAAYARARHVDRTEFDPYFDWRDHTRLYCTEFAALALHAGGRPLPALVRLRDNASLSVAFDWLKLSAPEIVTATSLADGAERVALISRRYDRDEIHAYFAARHELHRRFTADQKLGNVWFWSWRGLRLRPQVAAFLEASRTRRDEPLAAIADEVLGTIGRPSLAAQGATSADSE
ncbi:MAG: hypothetical protein ACREUC_05625 [Steroidobacteraceae bacterium]